MSLGSSGEDTGWRLPARDLEPRQRAALRSIHDADAVGVAT